MQLAAITASMRNSGHGLSCRRSAVALELGWWMSLQGSLPSVTKGVRMWNGQPEGSLAFQP